MAFDTSPHGYDRISLGTKGFDRITGAASIMGEFIAIRCESDLIFDAGCTMEEGDPPAENDVMTAGETLPGPFTNIAIKSGTAYCYRF